jgi:hypothetical protein
VAPIQSSRIVFVNMLASFYSLSGSPDFLEIRGSITSPQVSLRLEIPLGKVSPAGVNQVFGSFKTPGRGDALAEVTEESFDQIKQRSTAGREVEAKAGMIGQLSHHLGVFLDGVVVQIEVESNSGRRRRIDCLEEPQPL